MDIDVSAFHFLRPWWLLLLLPGVLLPWLWSRRHDLARRLDGIIAPHLLQHLVITPVEQHRVRPVQWLGALLMIGAVAASGPTWEQDRPAFLKNRAPVILALDLSPSMAASDVPPSRIEAARHKLHDLIARRPGSSTALIAYAGSAHLVLPATQDAGLLDSFLQALAPGLIQRSGKDALGAIEIAKRLLAAEQSPGTLVLLTDGADKAQFDAIDKALRGTDLQVLVLAVGSQDGGLLAGSQQDAAGHPLLGTFDAQGLKDLADAADRQPDPERR